MLQRRAGGPPIALTTVATGGAAHPARCAGEVRTARAAGATVADQPRRTAVTPGLRQPTGSPVAAIAVQQTARAAVSAGVRPSVGAVTDQRTAQHGLGRRVYRGEHVLPQVLYHLKRGRVGRLGRGVGAGTGVEHLDKLIVEHQSLGTECLIRLGVGIEETRDQRRYLVRAGRHHGHGGAGRRRVRGAEYRLHPGSGLRRC